MVMRDYFMVSMLLRRLISVVMIAIRGKIEIVIMVTRGVIEVLIFSDKNLGLNIPATLNIAIRKELLMLIG